MNTKTYFHRVSEQTPTKFWINNVTAEEAKLAIDSGAVGCTQNPTYLWKLIKGPEKDYIVHLLDKILVSEKDYNFALIKLQRELVTNIAKIFMPLFTESKGLNGYVSIQGDPFNEDLESLLKYARFNCETSPNIMAKIPVTEEGLKAIEILIPERIPINATEVMSVKQAIDVCEIYKKVIKIVENPAPIYFSHITGIYDEYLKKTAEKNNINISADALWQAGMIVAKKIYSIIKEKGYPVGFIGGGARGLHHFTEMVGADCCITINWKGTADKLIEQNPPVVQRFFQPVPESVLDELVEKVEDFRKAYFINAIKVNEYENFGPVEYFRNAFCEAWEASLEFTKNRRLELKI